MRGKIPVTAIVTTLNEEKNLARCLAALEDFDEIIVLDSNSTDRTADIARSFAVSVIPFTWNGQYPKKRQWALDNLVLKHDRIFFIDADEEATFALCEEIAALDWSAPGYFVKGLYTSDGKILRYGMHNKKLCLFDRTQIAFPVVNDLDIPGVGEMEGHYQPVLKDGRKAKLPVLRHAVLHHALEDKERYTDRHAGYALWQKAMLQRKAHPSDPVFLRRIAKNMYQWLPLKGLFFFVYYYFFRLGFIEAKNNIAIYMEKRKYHANQP